MVTYLPKKESLKNGCVLSKKYYTKRKKGVSIMFEFEEFDNYYSDLFEFEYLEDCFVIEEMDFVFEEFDLLSFEEIFADK